jgi:HEAT repeat protein
MSIFDIFKPNMKVKEKIGVEKLIIALEDSSSRMENAEVLAGIGKQAIKPLIKALKNPHGGVQAGAAYALGKIGDVRAVKPLIRILNDEDVYVRGTVAAALGRIGDARAVKPLIHALKQDVGKNVRLLAAGALGKIGDARAVDALTQALRDEDENVQKVADESLKMIEAQKRGVGIGIDVEKLAAKKDVKGLIKVLQYKKDDEVRTNAAIALREVGDTRAVEPLIEALKDKNEEFRLRVIAALGTIADPKAVDPLIRMLTKEEPYRVQLVAVITLGDIADPKAVDSLIQVLKTDDINFRTAAAEALGKIGDDRAVEPLIRVLHDQDNFAKRLAAEALGKIGDARAIPYLTKAAKDNDKDVRKVAKEALGKIDIRKEESVPTFVRKDQKGNYTYKIYKSADAESAKLFLLKQKVDRPQYYITVETPEGIWGMDKEGLYLVKLLPWQSDLSLADCEGKMSKPPTKFSAMMAVNGQMDNFVAQVQCGKCGYEWLDGLRYKNITIVHCSKCKSYNTVDSNHFIVTSK